MYMNNVRLGFFSSHGGSNFQAIVDACYSGKLAAIPALLICNNKDAFVLERAAQAKIPAFVLNTKTHPNPEELDVEILRLLKEYEVELIALTGYMRKVGAKVLSAFEGRILNIHPALLPKFGGQGMYGLNVHRAVLESGEKETGATIHLVNEEYDKGRILAQVSVPVLAGDTPESLSSRVIAKEHELYVDTLMRIVSGEIALPLGRDGRSKD